MTFFIRTFVAVCLAIPFAGLGRAAEPAIELQSPTTQPRFVVGNLPQEKLHQVKDWRDEEWQAVFAVYTVVEKQRAPTPLLGEYVWSEGKLSFAPRFPLRPGLTYRAILRVGGDSANAKETTKDFAIPSKEAAATRLTQVFPTRDVVPENLLKFYLHFSAPMSRGEVYQRVRLLDQNGKTVEYPFLELAEELWSPDGKRLTLYFDPGRIKRGLKPRELFGPALIEGQRYSLMIDPSWRDAEGRPLAEPVKKSFRVTEPDDVQPSVKQWAIHAPAAGTREPLRVQFEEPLDSAMLERVLSVQDARDEEIAGDISISKNEMEWSFRPTANWTAGRYSVVVATSLEDLAGNSIGRPFEVDVFRPAPKETDVEVKSVPFTIPPSPSVTPKAGR